MEMANKKIKIYLNLVDNVGAISQKSSKRNLLDVFGQLTAGVSE